MLPAHERMVAMECVQNVAKYICDEYKRVSGEAIDEMKLHKLLYFTQRESIAVAGEPMFNAEFEGWKYGPVCKEIRATFYNGQVHGKSFQKISSDNAYIARNIIEGYGSYASWKLSDLSHREMSWCKARKGLKYNEDGNALLLLSDIRLDAENVRPYDYLYDMHWDEFDNVHEWFGTGEPVIV